MPEADQASGRRRVWRQPRPEGLARRLARGRLLGPVRALLDRLALSPGVAPSLGVAPTRPWHPVASATRSVADRPDASPERPLTRTLGVETTAGQVPEPSRRVAVVQSDIVSSTYLLEAAGSDYPRLLLRHRALIASAVARRGGRFLSHAGDGTLAVFDRAGSALAAAVEAQRALAAEPWPDGLAPRVRMSLHVGDAFEIDGEPVGLVIHHGARIMAAAHPGQVMASTAAAEAADRDGLTEPGGYAVADAGWHELRDHAEPVRLVQVVADGLTVVTPEEERSAGARETAAGPELQSGRRRVDVVADRSVRC